MFAVGTAYNLLMHPTGFSCLYYLRFLPESVSDAHGIRHFFSIGFFILCASRLKIQILSFGCNVLSGWTDDLSFAWICLSFSFAASSSMIHRFFLRVLHIPIGQIIRKGLSLFPLCTKHGANQEKRDCCESR